MQGGCQTIKHVEIEKGYMTYMIWIYMYTHTCMYIYMNTVVIQHYFQRRLLLRATSV